MNLFLKVCWSLTTFLFVLFSTQTKLFVFSQLRFQSASTAEFVFDLRVSRAEQGLRGPPAPRTRYLHNFYQECSKLLCTGSVVRGEREREERCKF